MCISPPFHHKRSAASIDDSSKKPGIPKKGATQRTSTLLPPSIVYDAAVHRESVIHHIVRHDYHDHAQDHETLFGVAEDQLVARGGVTTPFPVRLHNLLERVEEEDLQDIVSWAPHGRCFVVHNPNRFVREVLPKYFKQSKFPSFQRQLNLYGFSRLTRGPDKNGYYHELFLRGLPNLAHRIPRQKVKGTGVRARSNPGKEPNFYEMPPLLPVVRASSQQFGNVESLQHFTKPDKAPSSLSSVSAFPSSINEDATAAVPLSTPSSQANPTPPVMVSDQDDHDEDLLVMFGKSFHYIDPNLCSSFLSWSADSLDHDDSSLRVPKEFITTEESDFNVSEDTINLDADYDGDDEKDEDFNKLLESVISL